MKRVLGCADPNRLVFLRSKEKKNVSSWLYIPLHSLSYIKNVSTDSDFNLNNDLLINISRQPALKSAMSQKIFY